MQLTVTLSWKAETVQWSTDTTGDGGEYSTFEEAKEFAIFVLEETIEKCEERLEEIRLAETYEDYESGRMSGDISGDQSQETR